MTPRILLVDDEDQIRKLLQQSFRPHGFAVSAAASSDEMLLRIEECKPHVIVLDIGLAEEDGLKVLGILKRRYPEIKVIMHTGMGLVEDLLQEAQQNGADGYVSKVAPFQELLATVQRLLAPAATRTVPRA